MSNIDKIRQEIERRKKENMHDDLPITIGRYYEDRDLLSFLDTLPEQPVEGLEEAAGLYLDNHKPLTRYNWGDLMDAFKAGAEWQKQQNTIRTRFKTRLDCYEQGRQDMREEMLKDAVDGFIFQSAEYYPKQLIAGYDGELGMGDKVKIVIIPEKEEKV